MCPNQRHTPFRVLFLISTPRLFERAEEMFREGAVPIQYQWNALGTAPNEMIDLLGLGNPEKSIVMSILPKFLADTMLKKLKKELRLGSINSGIAFTVPLSGANNLILRMLDQFLGVENMPPLGEKEKEKMRMEELKHALIVAIVNQGYSEEVMKAARKAGAGGGTIVHSRRIGNEEALGFWGMSIQEEKEMVLIVTKTEDKLPIMQAIGESCGMRSEAKGIVLSMPIDMVIGLNED